MKLVSTNVGLPRQVMWQGERVTTGIFKQPVSGRIRLGKLNLDGDGQADLAVHGGAEKAVYIYPSEHYMHWQMELPGFGLAWGAFGENFTTEGLLEEAEQKSAMVIRDKEFSHPFMDTESLHRRRMEKVKGFLLTRQINSTR